MAWEVGQRAHDRLAGGLTRQCDRMSNKAWKNLLVPEGEAASQDDADSKFGEVPPSAEQPVDKLLDLPESSTTTATESSDQATDSEEQQEGKLTTGASTGNESPSTSGADQDQSTSAPKMHTLPEDPEAFAMQMLARHSSMDDQRNKETSPPDDEHVTFRAVTLAELYVGREIDALMAALQAPEWVNTNGQFAAEMAGARQGDGYYNAEFLLSSGSPSHWSMQSYGKVDLPDGIHRIIGQLYLLGPSTVGLVLTFALTDAEAERLEKKLREYAKAELRYPRPGQVEVKSVYWVKNERVQAVVNDVGKRCLDWLKEWALGTLGAGDGLAVPLGSLISVAQGKPFEREQDAARWPPHDYLRLLDLAGSLGALKFDRPDYLFLKPRGGRRSREFLAAFNEKEASASHQDPSVAPEIFHQAIYSYMLVLSMEGILNSFDSRMRATRSDLAIFDFSKAAEALPLHDRVQHWFRIKRPEESSTEKLRNHLLVLSRDIAIVCGDIKGVIDDSLVVSLWADYPLLVPVEPSLPSPPQDPPSVPRKNLTEFIVNIKGQESELRELVLVTNQAVSEQQGERREKWLNRLTWVLVGLTLALLVAALIPLFHSSSDNGSGTPAPSTHASSPAPTHSLRPTPAVKPTIPAKSTPTHPLFGYPLHG